MFLSLYPLHLHLGRGYQELPFSLATSALIGLRLGSTWGSGMSFDSRRKGIRARQISELGAGNSRRAGSHHRAGPGFGGWVALLNGARAVAMGPLAAAFSRGNKTGPAAGLPRAAGRCARAGRPRYYLWHAYWLRCVCAVPAAVCSGGYAQWQLFGSRSLYIIHDWSQSLNLQLRCWAHGPSRPGRTVKHPCAI